MKRFKTQISKSNQLKIRQREEGKNQSVTGLEPERHHAGARLAGWAGSCVRMAAVETCWRGPGSGPAGAPGEGLAGWPGKGPAAARCRPRQGSCRGSRGLPRQEPCRGLLPSYSYFILTNLCLHKDLHATTKVPPEPCPNMFV